MHPKFSTKYVSEFNLLKVKRPHKLLDDELQTKAKTFCEHDM